MPKSKAPRKKYRPSGQVSINRIKTIRYSQESDTWLKLMPHQALDALRSGSCDTSMHNMLAVRLLWGDRMVSDHLLHQDEARAVMGAGVEAVRSVSDRFERIGNFCATGDELKRIGDALNLCDELQTITTRKEQEASLCAVLSISKQKLDLLSRT